MVRLACLDDSAEVDATALRQSAIASIVSDAADDGSSLDIPFRRASVLYVLNPTEEEATAMSFEDALDVVSCRRFLGMDDPDDPVLHRLYGVSMEIVRASGVNPFHFDQAVLFMTILNKQDDRIVPVPRHTLESLYWTCVIQKVHLEAEVIAWIGPDVYHDLDSCARRVRQEYNII